MVPSSNDHVYVDQVSACIHMVVQLGSCPEEFVIVNAAANRMNFDWQTSCARSSVCINALTTGSFG